MTASEVVRGAIHGAESLDLNRSEPPAWSSSNGSRGMREASGESIH